MKSVILSDIHGSLYYAKLISDILEREQADNLILLGDLYYHGPRNPLPRDYAPAEVAKILNSMKENVSAIRGNCDAEVDEMISEFEFQDDMIMYRNNKKIYFTHGHKFNMDKLPEDIFGINVMIYGHFHTGFIKQKDGIIFANPGSISLPKEDTEHSYLVLTEDEIILKNVEEKIIDKIKFC